MKKRNILISLVLITVGFSGASSAALIKGQLDFVGAAFIDRENGAYETIDYLFDPVVVIATGDYASSINFGDSVSVVDPINLSTLTLPETIWTIGQFSFSLEEITKNNGTTLRGNGFVSAAGFEDTASFWEFTSQGGDDGLFAFSATTRVSEPGVFALMAIGLLGLGLSRRKLKRKI